MTGHEASPVQIGGRPCLGPAAGRVRLHRGPVRSGRSAAGTLDRPRPEVRADIDHGPWDRFLAAYVEADGDGINRVAYGRVGAADAQALDGYIGGLAAVPISRYSRPRQLAYWINLYNALTVRLILDHYPVDSICDISSGFFMELITNG